MKTLPAIDRARPPAHRRTAFLGALGLLLVGADLGCASTAAPPAAPSLPLPVASAPSSTGVPPSDATPVGAGVAPDVVTAPARAVVDAADRDDADRRLDAGRHPAEFLTFLGVAPGMRVAELVAGAGYTAELLGRAVAPGGVVYAENPKFVLERSDGPWRIRLAKPAAKFIVRVDRELDDPLPPEAHDLDLVVVNLVYHDTVWLGVDREKMNHAIFVALRSGGRYAVIDHSARQGTGFNDVKTLHRVDEAAVRAEVERAGFVVRNESGFLRNPSDKRDWNDSPGVAGERRGTSDRFALLFVKP
jgi:predicted methyltransferase